MQDHNIVGGDGVAVYLDSVGAILLGIGFLDGLGREFARFAQRHKAGVEVGRQNGAAYKAASLDAHNLGHALVAIQVDHGLAHDAQGGRILKQRGQVFELYSRFWKIGHIAHNGLHFFNFFFVHYISSFKFGFVSYVMWRLAAPLPHRPCKQAGGGRCHLLLHNKDLFHVKQNASIFLTVKAIY